MKKIDIKGDIISNDLAWIYDWMEWDYTSPSKIQKELDNAKGEDVEFLVNSPGGDVWAGYEIFNSIKLYEGRTTSHIIGLAASCGSFIPLASDKVIAEAMAMMMIHGASTSTYGNQHNHAHTRDFLDKVDRTIVQAYTSKSGKSEEEFLKLMADESWFTADEMLDMGLIDEIVGKSTNTKLKVYNAADDAHKRELIDKIAEFGNVENLKKALLENQFTLGQPVTNTATIDNKIPQKGEKEMTLNELKAQYPDLCNQIAQDAETQAVTNERNRIQSINALSRPGVEAQIKEGIENGLSAGEVAINILNAQSAINKAQGEALKNDAEESGVNDVSSVSTPQNNDEQEKQSALSNMANIMNGGRK
nr:head maturation protease, ClpP-related [uncultured Cellulosilyticum sp.]